MGRHRADRHVDEISLRWEYRSDEAIPIMTTGSSGRPPMPLTPHEQRILEEIERRLAEEDPRLVESVARSTLASHALRSIRWGIAGFAVGFILLVLFVINLWV